MRKNSVTLLAVIFSVLLLTPIALASVYVPPGPPDSMSEWINPNLTVIDMQDLTPVGWIYSDGPMFDPHPSQFFGLPIPTKYPMIPKFTPLVPAGNKLDLPWGTQVMILGFIPDVVVPPSEVPPDVQLVITWNGIQYTVTMTLPPTQIVGMDFPPKFYPDKKVPYEFAYPAVAPYKDAYYNIWVGDETYIAEKFFGTVYPPAWWETLYGMRTGLWFWYKFYPNVGDWIAYDCQGETKFPPTYDITALFEYSTTQIWFSHVCFDVSLLELHKTVGWATLPWPLSDKIIDNVLITNVGKVKATKLDFIQTFPWGVKHYIDPDFTTAKARIDGVRTVGWTTLTGFGASWPYIFAAPFDYLDPGETMTITMQLTVVNLDLWSGSIVFDSMVSANEIPAWKEPIGLHSIEIGSPPGPDEPLWVGWKLFFDTSLMKWIYFLVAEWPVPGPILREELTHPPPKMTLDPVPVDLDGGGIGASDVALVRQAIVGLLPYDHRMDINANGKIDTKDLAAYKLAVT